MPKSLRFLQLMVTCVVVSFCFQRPLCAQILQTKAPNAPRKYIGARANVSAANLVLLGIGGGVSLELPVNSNLLLEAETYQNVYLFMGTISTTNIVFKAIDDGGLYLKSGIGVSDAKNSSTAPACAEPSKGTPSQTTFNMSSLGCSSAEDIAQSGKMNRSLSIPLGVGSRRTLDSGLMFDFELLSLDVGVKQISGSRRVTNFRFGTFGIGFQL